MQRRPRWRGIGWTTIGIRTKILIPLVILMLLSILGSTVGFIISTNTTRNSILDGRLDADSQRIKDAFLLSQRDAFESAEKLSQDADLINALVKEVALPNINRSRDMVDRAQPVSNRFGLDQVIVLDNKGKTRVNIGPSDLEEITVRNPELLPTCSSLTVGQVSYQDSLLLITCAPILKNKAPDALANAPEERLGTVYSILDIQEWVQRTEQELELMSEVQLLKSSDDAEQPDESDTSGSENDFRTRSIELSIDETSAEDHTIPLLLLQNTEDINEILESGLYVTLISSGATLLLLLVAGTWLAQSFTRPILKLSSVAQAVAEGDLSRRANLTHDDEIGRLGRSFDHATARIATLLDQQARTAGERQAILESIADGVLAVDTEERILVINPTAAALLHQHADALLDQPLEALLAEEDPALEVGLQHLIGQIRSELVDIDMAATEEQVALGDRIVRINSTPTLINGTTRTGAVVVIQDVTRIVEADRAKSDFIATASHEMRTPLTSLKGFVDVFSLSGTDNLNESQQVFLDTIKRQTDNMVQMVNDLLEVARLEQGTQRAERRWVRPGNALSEAVSHLNNLIAQRQSNVQTETTADVPSIWIDQLHLRRILTNLISNAVKYTHQGGTIVIRAYTIERSWQLPDPPNPLQPWPHQEDRSLVIAVEDNGVGIRQEDQAKIFTRFFRSENELSVEVGGTGLGLTVTKSLVELHEGQIGFWSIENQGSCFWVRFPVPSIDPLEERQSEQSQSDNGSTPTASPRPGEAHVSVDGAGI